MPLRSLLPAVLAILFLLLPARSGSAVADLHPIPDILKKVTASPPAGTAAPDSLVELQVLLVLYPKTFCKELSPAETERLYEEVAEFRHFYERAVGDRMRLAVDLLIVDRTLEAEEITQVAPGRFYLAREDLEAELRRLGGRSESMGWGPGLDRYDEVIALYAWDDVNRRGAQLAYGGGAVGPDGHFLADAGFNSQGIFAWDPGRISQILIHELLHNLDDMFGRAGMPDRFFSADDMSRNMALLLAERPGAFRPAWDDDWMRGWAEREARGEEGYPWGLQLVYYDWMLDRTPAAAWRALAHGRRVAAAPPEVVAPLYRNIIVAGPPGPVHAATWSPAAARAGRSGAEGPAGGPGPGAAPEEVGLTTRRGGTRSLARRLAEHTGFDGRTLYTTPFWGGWVDQADLGAGLETLSFTPPPGTRPASVLERIGLPAEAAGPAAPASAGPDWEVVPEGTAAAQVGRPFTLFLRARERGAVGDARVRVRVGERTYEAAATGPGEYEVALPPLPPGTPELVIEGARPGGGALTRSIHLPVEYRGTIVVEPVVAGRAGEPVTVEAWLRDRMGARVVGVPVPLVLVAADQVWPMVLGDREGVYQAAPRLPAGSHRLVVASLRGRGLYRQMVDVTVRPDEGAGRRPAPTRAIEAPALPWGLALAPRRPGVTVDGGLEEWSADGPSLTLGPASQVLTDPARYAGAGDLEAELWLAWAPGWLYVAGRVRDDVVTFGEQWDSDRLNLVFDMNNDTTPLTYGEPYETAGAVGSERWTPDDFWVLTRLFTTGPIPPPTAAVSGPVPGRVIRVGKDTFRELTGAASAVRRTAAGYDFELALPAAELPAWGEGFPGKVVGLQVFFTDGDGEATISELMWKGRWGYDSGGIHWELHELGQLLCTGQALDGGAGRGR